MVSPAQRVTYWNLEDGGLCRVFVALPKVGLQRVETRRKVEEWVIAHGCVGFFYVNYVNGEWGLQMQDEASALLVKMRWT